jgi:hypothetical protein
MKPPARKRSTKKTPPASSIPTTSTSPEPALEYIAEPIRSNAVPLGALAPDPANPTTHDDSNVAAIAASLREFGQVKNVVGNRRTGLLIAGHGTLEAARRLGWTHLACAWIDCDERTAHRLMLADNRTAELAGYDQDLLDELLTATVQPDDDLYEKLGVDQISDALVDEVLAPETELKQLAIDRPPALTWVLIGIPTARFSEIAGVVEDLAAIPDIIMETTVGDAKEDG